MKKLKIKLKSNCNAKLYFVKLLKETTGLGLKESKDIVDHASFVKTIKKNLKQFLINDSN